MRDSGFFDVAAARTFAAEFHGSPQRSGSTVAGDDPGRDTSISSRTGPGRGHMLLRLHDGLTGDVIGALALFALLVGGLWIGAGLS